jgi:hypothetical protein
MILPGFFEILMGFFSEPLPLNFTGAFHARLDGRRRLAQAAVAELVVLHPRHFDVDVNAIQQWAGDTFLKFGDRTG